MDLNSGKSRWKIYLAIIGAIIVGITMVYTQFLTNKLAQEERRKAEIWVMAMKTLAESDEEENLYCDYTLHLKNFSIQYIYTCNCSQ